MKKNLHSILTLAFTVSFAANSIAQISFTNRNARLGNANFHSGCPVAIVDWNNDGLDDIVRLDDGRYCNVEVQITDNQYNNVYLGDFGGGAWAMAVADVDHNGYRDIVADGSQGIGLLKTNATGTAATLSWLPASGFFLQNATFGDFNNDGWIDIFCCDDNAASHIYQNDGTGNFSMSGIINFNLPNGSDNSGNYGSVWTDFDNDGDLDLYIAKCRQGVSNVNDPRRIDVLFVNDGNNNYTEMAATYGVANGWQTWTASFGDINNDGDLDLLATNHDHESQIFENDGTGHYTDITSSTGFDITDIMPIESVMEDFDNDGFVDLLITGSDARFYKNNGNGTFTKITGLFDSNDMESFAVGDLNHDGFIDIYASYANIYTTPTNIDDVIWMNDRNANNFFTLQLKGTISNQSAIGTRAKIYGAWGVQLREVRAGESYGTINSAMLHFGLGTAAAIDSVVINWPSGTDQTIVNPAINQFLTVTENLCVSPQAALTLSGPPVLCSGQNLTITAPAGYNYLWSDGSTNQSILVTTAGDYNVIVSQTGNACVAQSPTISVVQSPNQTPVISASGETEFCSGSSVQLLGPAGFSSYTWSNGDTTQNATITQSGTYTLTVQGYCQAWTSSSISVTVHTVADPSASNVNLPSPGSTTITATGNNVSWYPTSTGGTVLYTGNSFTTPVLNSTTTYWMQAADNFGGGIFPVGVPYSTQTYSGNNTTNALMYFDVLDNCILKTVKVYTDLPGTRRIELRDANATLINFVDINILPDSQVVTLNFNLTPGIDYTLGTDAAFNQAIVGWGNASPRLTRNQTGVAYPYTLIDGVSLTGTSFGAQYFYYFYDWQVQLNPLTCLSNFVPVTVFVGPVGIQELAKNGISVFPNPAKDVLNINFNELLQSHIKIYDATARLVKSEITSEINNKISIADLNAGVYQMFIEKGGKQFIHKLILN